MTEENSAQIAKMEEKIRPEGWKNAPSVADLKKDLEAATPFRDRQRKRIKRWLNFLHVEGEAAPKKVKNRSNVQPQLIRKQAEWRYPSLSDPFLSSSDLFELEPETWEDTDAAFQNGLVLNNQWNTQIDKQYFIDEYVRTAVDEGTVIVKVSWENEEEEYEEEEQIFEFEEDPTMAPVYQEIMAFQENNPTAFEAEIPQELQDALPEFMESGIPLRPIPTGRTQLVKKYRTLVNRPHPEVCDYRNITVDPSCQGNVNKARFIIHSYPTSLDQLRKEGRYHNLEQINVQNTTPLNAADHEADDDENFEFNDEARKQFVAHEYWGFWDYDGSGVTKPFVATWVGNVLIRLEETPYPDRELPFVFVRLLPVRRSPYGEPDAELLIDNQKIVGAVTRGMVDLMGRSANAQLGTRKDALDAVNKRKFDNGQDYQYNGNTDPRVAFYMHQYPEIPRSAEYMLQNQNMEAESMTGVKAFSSGINSESLGDVARGINGALSAAGKREVDILRRLAAGVVKIGRKIVMMNSEFLEDEEIIRVTNDNFVAIRREDLGGKFDIRMDISTPEEDNMKAQELSFMLQTMGNNMDMGMQKIIMRRIARLRKMPELAHEIENYEPQPDPMQQEIQRLEIVERVARIREINSKAYENETDAALNMAKAGSESAKARDLNSTADKKDLEFVEQESGVTQEREKELQGEQARANMALKTHEKRLEAASNLDSLQSYLGGNL